MQSFQLKFSRAPGLAVVLVGDDQASQVYVRNKEQACSSVGIHSLRYDLASNASQSQILDLLQSLNHNNSIDGILVQLPLPKGLAVEPVLETISPEKDADGLTYSSLGFLWAGRPKVVPCTPMGIMTILKHYQISLAKKKAVVVGRSNIVGKPMAQLLMDAQATVTICHSQTSNLSDYTREADIVVVAAGKPRLLGRNDFKRDSVVIDVGIHGSGGGKGLCGDVRFEELDGWVRATTPVPGGVGPMTITTLLENTVTLAEARTK